MKRIVRKQKTEKKEEISENDLYNRLMDLLNEWEEMLSENDKAYGFEGSDDRNSFKNSFMECPFIKALRIANGNEKNMYQEFVKNVITNKDNVVEPDSDIDLFL